MYKHAFKVNETMTYSIAPEKLRFKKMTYNILDIVESLPHVEHWNSPEEHVDRGDDS
jgi:hypothetical protein